MLLGIKEFGLNDIMHKTAKCFPVEKRWSAIIPIHHVHSLPHFFLGALVSSLMFLSIAGGAALCNSSFLSAIKRGATQQSAFYRRGQERAAGRSRLSQCSLPL